MANTCKNAKEQFVANLLGGTISEINWVTLTAPASVLFWSALQKQYSLFTPYSTLACISDILLNCAAILFATTLYSSTPIVLNASLIIPTLCILLLPTLGQRPVQRKTPRKLAHDGAVKEDHVEDMLPIKPFVSTYRGTMLVVTCVAILAVDFHVFPRRFAKVENWGTSLMDLGVGSFVFSAGTVAVRPVLKQQLAGKSQSLSSRLQSSVRHALPLLVLGLIRLYSVKGLDYAEHVSEYGVHWNFFFTLAFIPPFVAIFDSAFQILPSYAAFALIIGIAYELVLDNTELKTFILSAPRVDLLSQNREGIFSCFGYLAIYLAGQGTGMYILPRPAQQNNLWQDSVLRKLIIWSVSWCAMFFLATDYRFGFNLPVSRRLANLPYVLWVTAFSCCQITAFYLVERVAFPRVHSAKSKEQENEQCKQATSRVLRSFNRNGLAIFLLANLLTGLVNLTVCSLDVGNYQATTILFGYMLLLAAVALTLDEYNISIKL